MRSGTVHSTESVIPGFVVDSFGNYVLVQGSDGRFDLYAHLVQDSVMVAPGEQVERGQVLGELGSTGDSTGPHVHVQVADSSALSAQSKFFRFGDSDLQADGGVPKHNATYVSEATLPARVTSPVFLIDAPNDVVVVGDDDIIVSHGDQGGGITRHNLATGETIQLGSGLNEPRGMVIVGNTLLCAVRGESRVIKVFLDNTPTVEAVIGTGVQGYSGDGGSSKDAELDQPEDVTVDPNGVDVYVADTGNDAVRVVFGVSGLGAIQTFAGGSSSAGSLSGPSALAILTTTTLFIGENSGQIKFMSQGSLATVPVNGQIAPTSIEFEPGGSLLFSESASHRVRRIVGSSVSDHAGSTTQGWREGERLLARFDSPRGLAYHAGFFYVCDHGNNMVRRYPAQ
jgi:hypothetical protein